MQLLLKSVFKLFICLLFALLSFTSKSSGIKSPHTVLSGISPLSGSYTVGTAGSDYLTLEAAISDLELHGMTGPVTLGLEPGTYQTHVTIEQLNRVNQADDWLTITSESGTAVLQHDAQSSSDNWVIKLNNTSFVKIKNLTLEATGTADLNNIIVLGDNSSHINIENNQLISYVVNGSTDDEEAISINVTGNSATVNNINIHNNEFNSGNSAIRIIGTVNNPSTDVSIKNNSLSQQLATGVYNVIKLNSVDGFEVVSNVIETNLQNAKGLNLFNVSDGVIERNVITIADGLNGGVGLRIAKTNDDPNDTITIKNNFIKASPIGIRISAPSSNNIDVFHNTIVMSQTVNIDTNTLKISDTASNINFRNNILINRIDNTQAHVITIDDSSSISSSDHNLFYAMGNDMFVVDQTNYMNLNDYQNATAMDVNSIFKSVDFIDEATGDFHLLPVQYTDPDLFTTPINGVLYDLDSEFRNPVITLIGADDLLYGFIFANGFE